MKNRYIPIILALSAFSLVGCSSPSQSSSSVSSEKTGTIVLNARRVNLLPGDQYQLDVTFTDAVGEYKYEASGSVSVSNSGLVTASSVGSGSVTLSIGSASASCEFNVSFEGQTPIIKIPGISDYSLTMDMSESFTLEPKVSFNGKLNDFTPTFTAEDPSVVKVEGNVLTGLKTGTTSIEIGGSFYGESLLPYYLNVEVKESAVFAVYDGEDYSHSFDKIALYTAKALRGREYLNEMTANIKLSIDGVDHSNEVECLIEDESGCVSYDAVSKKITAVKAGNATLKLSYLSYSKTIDISVNPVLGKFEGDIAMIDASDGVFPCDAIFSEFDASDRTILSATTLEGEPLEVKDGKVLGLKSHNLEEQEIILFNSQVGLTVKYKAYARIIKEASDLNDFIIDFGQGSEALEKVKQFQNDGYYLLANDIDCTGVSYPNQTRVLGVGAGSLDGNLGFRGTFDGQGHIISNLNAVKGGLFLVLGNGASVRNVAFKNVNLQAISDADHFTLCTYAYSASISNVYIECSSRISCVNNAPVAANFSGTEIKDCLFEYTGEVTIGSSYGSFTHLKETAVSAAKFLVNSYMISSTPMTVAKKYYADVRQYEGFEELEYREYPNVKHYLNYDEMKEAENDYSSFNPEYWETVDGVLHFKGI